LTDANVPVGISENQSGQHAKVPSILIAQDRYVPTLTAVKRPAGGVTSRQSSTPLVVQPLLPTRTQVSVPSDRIPHMEGFPTLKAAKVPAMDGAGPFRLRLQHATVPSVFNPQAKSFPTLTEVKVPAGGTKGS
jgi:hypothetical protein